MRLALGRDRIQRLFLRRLSGTQSPEKKKVRPEWIKEQEDQRDYMKKTLGKRRLAKSKTYLAEGPRDLPE